MSQRTYRTRNASRRATDTTVAERAPSQVRRLAGAVALVVIVIAAICAETAVAPLFPFPMPDFLRERYWPVAVGAAGVVAVIDAVAIMLVMGRIRSTRGGQR